jgi:N-hydroxyarylamine O-acetyltransferase
MDIALYLDRIGYSFPVRPDLDTLKGLMRAHLASVPFENLDQQLGRNVTTDLAGIYDKIVARRRGGWCFEVNTLLQWALEEIGFTVAPLAGHVGRSVSAPEISDNHKCLRVDLDGGAFLVDVGYGGSQIDPIPLAPGEAEQTPYHLSITETGDGFLRFSDAAHDSASSFDFTPEPVAPDHFDASSLRLQRDPASPFRLNLTAQRRFADRHLVLRGKILRTVTANGVEERQLASADDLVTCLKDRFDLDVAEASGLWPRIEARHAEIFNTAD